MTNTPSRFQEQIEILCAAHKGDMTVQELDRHRQSLEAGCVAFLDNRQRLLKRANKVLCNLWPAVNGVFVGTVDECWKNQPVRESVRYVFSPAGVLSVFLEGTWQTLAQSLPGKPCELDTSVLMAGEPEAKK